MAAALEPEPRHPVRRAEVFHAACVRAEVGPHPVERALHPRVDVERMQVVQQQQAFDQGILGQLVQHRHAGVALVPQRGHDMRQPVAVQADQQPDQFLGGRGRILDGARTQCVKQFLDPRADISNAAQSPRLRAGRPGGR